MRIYLFDLDDTLFDSSGIPDTDVNPLIKVFPGVREILQGLDGQKILVTKGDELIQTEKIKKLGIGDLFNRVYICAKDEDKLKVFLEIKDKHQDGEFWVIGNRIDCEIRYGNMLGLKTIYLRHGKYSSLVPKDSFEIAHVVVDKFIKINNYLK